MEKDKKINKNSSKLNDKKKTSIKNSGRDVKTPIVKKEEIVKEPTMENIVVDKKEEVKKSNSVLKVLFGIILLIGLFGLVFYTSTTRDGKETPSMIQDTTGSEFQALLNSNEKAVVLIAKPDCPWCQRYKPIINQVANEYNVVVYYVNTSLLSNDEYIYLHDNISVLKDQYDSYGNPVIPTPMTVIVQSGKDIDNIEGYVEKGEIISFLKKNGII